MRRAVLYVLAFALAFPIGIYAAHVVTEQIVVVQDPPAMTTVVGKRTVIQNPPPMTTTVIDTDTVQHDTVTVTVTGTTTADPPPVDTEAPSVPQGQQLSEITQNSARMTWNASTDNVGVVHYNVLLDGVEVGDTNGLEWYYQSLTCGTTYTVGLSAEDAAGNKSDPAYASGPFTTAACDTQTTTTTEPPPPPPPPTGCSVSVVPGGDLTAAYNSVPDGGVVCLSEGLYGNFTTPGGTKNVTFRGVYPGTVFRSIGLESDNFHLENIEIRGSDSTDSRQWPVGPILATNGHKNFSFKNGKVSRARDHMMVLVGGQVSASNLLNIVFDGIVFSDLEFSGLVPDAHGECVYSQAPGLVVRNSTFRNCWVMDLFITRGTWWGQEEYGNVTIENNVFWHSVLEPNGWHYYGFAQAYDNEAFNFTIRNNWFENNVTMSGPFTGNSVVCGNNTGIMPAGFQPLAGAVPASWKTPCA